MTLQYVKAAPILVACLLGVGIGAEQTTSPTADALLKEVITAHRIGDFPAAWDAFVAFFTHPSRNELRFETFVDCFAKEGCPDPGVLGQILAKPRQALAPRINGFCPRIRREPPEQTTAEERAILHGVYDRMVAQALGGSCQSWQQRQLALMLEDPQPLQVIPEALPLTWQEFQDGGVNPTVAAFIGRTPLRLVIDTGSNIGNLYRGNESFPHAEVEIVGEQSLAVGIYDYFRMLPARLTSLRVGQTLHQPYVLDVELGVRQGLQPISRQGVLGMAFLLRYSSVCFAWEQHRLYLGSLGPCDEGVSPHGSHLTGSLLFGYTVRADSGTSFTGYVDTGAEHTHCSMAFTQANAGKTSFAFGSHPALVANCLPDEAVLFRPPEFGSPQVAIRMNDLLRFRAFGWQLHPFKVLFLPQSNPSTSTADAS